MASSTDSKKNESTKKTTSTAKKSSTTSKEANTVPKTVTIAKGSFFKYLAIAVVIILTIVLIDFAVQYINNDYSVAVVNGERIPTSEFESRLKEAYGEVIATQVINEALIMQEAEEEGITVSDDDVQEMVDETIEQLGGEDEFETALAANGLTEETYRRNLRIQLIAEELIVEEPNEEQLQDFFTQYQEVYWTAETKFEDVQEEVVDIYRTQKFNEESPVWLADLRAKSDIQDNVADKPTYGILKITWTSIEGLNNRIEETDSGESDNNDTDDAGDSGDEESGEEESGEDTGEENAE